MAGNPLISNAKRSPFLFIAIAFVAGFVISMLTMKAEVKFTEK